MVLPEPSSLEMRQTALYGFHRARSRFLAGAAVGDEMAAFVGASEALWWACTLDEQLRDEGWYLGLRQEHSDGCLMPGLVYARNRTTHALPMTVRFDDRYSDSYSATYGVIVWRAVNELPEPEPQHRQGQDVYRDRVAGAEVAATFDCVARWFAALQNDVRARLGEPMHSTGPPWDDGRGLLIAGE